MLIDTHCHIDQFSSPEDAVRECETSGVRVVAVTNLPSHFAVAADRLREHPLVSAALGIHPLSAKEGMREMAAFKRMAPHANFIGEIGLDFSRYGEATKSIQEHVFEEILSVIRDRPRFITLHSRGRAEKAVLEGLRRHEIKAAVFHWFSGPAKVLDEVFTEGHFISINPAMLSSAKGERIIAQSPRDRILIESDGPFAKVQGKSCKPNDVLLVYKFLADRWKISIEEVILCIKNNFERITDTFRRTPPF